MASDPQAAELERLRAENEELHRRLEELESELSTARQLVANLAEAEDQGRRRIAQIIHDDSLQTLLAAHQELIEAAPGRQQVQRAHEVVGAAIDRLREALLSLHPVTLEQGGLAQAMGAVGRQAERQGGFKVEMDIDPAALDIHDELMLAIARELLTNAARHSQATHVTARLRRDGDELELEIADNGVGMEPGRPESALAQGHIGLASVKERVAQAGGRFELESDPSGTRARARVPVEPRSDDA